METLCKVKITTHFFFGEEEWDRRFLINSKCIKQRKKMEFDGVPNVGEKKY